MAVEAAAVMLLPASRGCCKSLSSVALRSLREPRRGFLRVARCPRSRWVEGRQGHDAL